MNTLQRRARKLRHEGRTPYRIAMILGVGIDELEAVYDGTYVFTPDPPRTPTVDENAPVLTTEPPAEPPVIAEDTSLEHRMNTMKAGGMAVSRIATELGLPLGTVAGFLNPKSKHYQQPL